MKNIWILVLIVASWWGAAPVMAAALASSGSIAQGFVADSRQGQIAAGALVSFTTGSSRSVELATTASAGRLAGVVDQSPLVVISGGAQEAQVVLSGTTTVLVSDINGPIHASDKITASPIAGVGMLATADSQIVGAAQASFDTAHAQSRSLKDRSGQAHTVHLGTIPIQIGVAYYQAPGSNFLPPFIQSLANSVAGRPVSLLRVMLSTVLLLLGFVCMAVLIYSSVRSAITSLGRNPLAAVAIRAGLYQVGGVVLVTIGGILVACYFILTL
ncbi:MAG TPA: hypothetical protein VLI05_06270 [Candidatus Saccharimonadia bacterium]|nr:hypothetical protein [Candidatus Saccharimonadia bacterium]